VRGLRRPISVERTPLAIGAAVAALAILVTGVGAYLLLPTATIVLTPRLEVVGPVPLTITADPEVTAPDPARAIIPAQRLTFDLQAIDSFEATGKRIEADPSVGQVTFENYDPTARNVIPAGSVVSTEGGIRFRTTAAVSVPAGTFVLPEVVPGKATIGVEAVRPGPEGNVPANAINVVPSEENPIFLRVRNREPTAGGARREFRRVSRADIDGALVSLQTQLGEQFDTILQDPATVPEGTTIFAETQRIGEGTPTSDPEAVLGQETESFQLSMTATGSVIAVDEAPVAAIVDARVRENVSDGYQLVEGSMTLEPGEATVADELVLFPLVAHAEQVRAFDQSSLLAEIKGKPIPQARTILEGLGQVTIDAWPDWVTSIPTLEARLELRIEQPDTDPSASPSAAP
jgi:baseplate J-like protein